MLPKTQRYSIQNRSYLLGAETDVYVGLPWDLVGRLHQLGNGVVHVADSVENALPLKSIGPLEHQVKVCNGGDYRQCPTFQLLSFSLSQLYSSYTKLVTTSFQSKDH